MERLSTTNRNLLMRQLPGLIVGFVVGGAVIGAIVHFIHLAASKATE